MIDDCVKEKENNLKFFVPIVKIIFVLSKKLDLLYEANKSEEDNKPQL